MIFREALLTDIPQIQSIRNAVKENSLSDPALVPDKDVAEYITHRGKGWVCEANDRVIGFAIADLKENNIWALFIQPGYEGRGIGRRLHDEMLDWYFDQDKELAWLSTSPGTRAEIFYRKAGWREIGTHGKGEIKFGMTGKAWRANKDFKQ
jgi:GNAT superfamily N-acetyltransferase